MTEGFRCWSLFDKEAKRLHQLYDFTLHLYGEEHRRIQEAVDDGTNAETLLTAIGTISHKYLALRDHTRVLYPDRIRELIIVRLVSALEAFLLALVEAIFERDLQPFKTQTPVEFSRSHLLALPSIRALQQHIIERDVRLLSNGGLEDMRKYYKKHFSVYIAGIGVSYPVIEELHDRRHLFVHRMGVCDSFYAHKYPVARLGPGDKVGVGHDYVLRAFSVLRAFGRRLKDTMAAKFPTSAKRTRRFRGSVKTHGSQRFVMLVKIEITSRKYDPVTSIPALTAVGLGRPLKEFIFDLIADESIVTIIFGAEDQAEVKAIMTTLRKNSKDYILGSAVRVME